MADVKFVVVRTRKFGWCQDDIHTGCTIRFAYYERDYQCACDCHDGQELPPLVAGKNVSPVHPDKPERAPRKKK